MTTRLTLSLDGDRQLVVTRRFRASPERIWRAHTDPTVIPKWMTGPDGWSMPVCQADLRPGGQLRFEWANASGHGFYLTGEYLELEPHRRIVHVERMFMPDRCPDNHVETIFESDGQGGTKMTMRMTAPDEATRKAMLASGMEHGMEASYARLDGMEIPA